MWGMVFTSSERPYITLRRLLVLYRDSVTKILRLILLAKAIDPFSLARDLIAALLGTHNDYTTVRVNNLHWKHRSIIMEEKNGAHGC